MRSAHCFPRVVTVLLCLLLAGCDDSKYPLSDPRESKPDARLSGLWRLEGSAQRTAYYHIGPMGGKHPGGMLRVVVVVHSKNAEIGEPNQLLMVPVTLGNKSYLSIAQAKPPQFKAIEENGWNSDLFAGFLLVKYEIAGNRLQAWMMDAEAKKQAIQAGKVKGLFEKGQFATTVKFTDSTENLARCVAAEGDGLFSKESFWLERIK